MQRLNFSRVQRCEISMSVILHPVVHHYLSIVVYLRI